MQFGAKRYKNRGVYAVLKPPNFESPSFHSFKTLERPQVWSEQFITFVSFFFPCFVREKWSKHGHKINIREH